MNFCKHGIPTCGAPCRFCADGTEPSGHPVDPEHEAKRSALRAAWTKEADAIAKARGGK